MKRRGPIVSFAWTTEAYKAGQKIVTRRDWPDRYARIFRPGLRFQAWSKNPRYGGRFIGFAEVVSVRIEPLDRMLTDPVYGLEEIEKEGGLWDSPGEFVAAYREGRKLKRTDGTVVRLEFRKVDEDGRQML